MVGCRIGICVAEVATKQQAGPMTAARRQQRHRERERQGRGLLTVEVDLYGLADVLVEHGFLRAWDADDKRAIEAAVERLINTLIVTRDASAT